MILTDYIGLILRADGRLDEDGLRLPTLGWEADAPFKAIFRRSFGTREPEFLIWCEHPTLGDLDHVAFLKTQFPSLTRDRFLSNTYSMNELDYAAMVLFFGEQT